MAIQAIKIFISSPGDVGQERLIATRVLGRLQGEFAAYADLQPILWEHEPLRATAHFQEQIVPPSQTDIVICILWSRLGTRLPTDKFVREDGSHYDSGTEWEFEDAANSFLARGAPDLMVYRKTSDALTTLTDEEALLGRLQQKKALDGFIERWFGSAQSTFKAAFHTFQSPDQFEELIENHLRNLIRERLPKHLIEEGGTKTPIFWHKGSPFRGLEAFDVEHAPIFFGRTRAIGEIKDALVARAAAGCAALIVFGMSGSGKSSLVRAGVLPTLAQPGVVEGIGLWRWSIFRPGDAAADILHALAAALLEPGAVPELSVDGLDAVDLAELCRESPKRFLSLLRIGLKRAAETEAQREKLTQPPETRLALVIDQMEELFTLEHLSVETREAFVVMLSTLARSGVAWVIGTMRSDFYPRCAEIPELIALKEQGGQYDLLPPSFAEIRQMISQPAQAAGLRFEIDPKSGENLNDVLHEAACRELEGLPLLEFTLDDLYKERSENGVLTFAAYQKLGGIEGALARRAEDVFLSLPHHAQEVLPQVLRVMVAVEEQGSRIARRRVPVDDLATTAERKAILDAFIAARLFVVDRADDGGAVVGVAHEALLRHWPRLQQWLEEDQEFLLQRERVANAAALWKKENRESDFLLHEGKALTDAVDILIRRRSELGADLVDFIETSQRRTIGLRRRKAITAISVASAFFVVVSGFGLVSYFQWQRAEKQKDLALQAINAWTRDIPDKLRDVPGTLPVLREIFEKNVGALDSILKLSPNTPSAMREKAMNYRHSGDTWRVLGATQLALDAYEKCFAISEKIAQSNDDFQTRRDLATCYERIGDTRFEIGDLTGAEVAYLKDLEITQALFQDGNSKETKNDLSVSYEKIGDVLWQKEDNKQALATYQKSLALREEIATDKSDVQAQRSLAVSHEKLGHIWLALGEGQHSLEAYRTSLTIRLTLAKAKPKNIEIQRDLAVGYTNLGDIRQHTGDAVGAMAAYLRAHSILNYLARDRFSVSAQLGLAESYNRIGALRLAMGDNTKALDSFRRSIAITQEVASDETNIQARKYLVESYSRLVWVALLARLPKESISAATKALQIDSAKNDIKVNLAHAYLFDNQVDKAIAIYLKSEGLKVNDKQTFADVVLADFKDFKSQGLTHPEMDRIARLIAEARRLP